MTNFRDQILLDNPRRGRISRYKPAVLVLIPLGAILFQVYLPLFFQSLS